MRGVAYAQTHNRETQPVFCQLKEEDLNQKISCYFLLRRSEPNVAKVFSSLGLSQIPFQAQSWHHKLTPSFHKDHLEHGEITFLQLF